ncbi:hypothetical protein JW935_02560 [candidate division KSB1 bacterium]|nr:hypothetical protein [candidate division KSB1 bacterium]
MDSPQVTDFLTAISEAEKLTKKHDYKTALKRYESLFNENPLNEKICLGYVCCQLATGETSKALSTCTFLLQNIKEATFTGRAQASLILDDRKQALHDVESALIHEQRNNQLYFLAAVIHYKAGFIGHVFQNLRAAIQNGFEWIDDDPPDILVQRVLAPNEFTDLEQIYLDVLDEIHAGHQQGQNRWFFINMPIFDFLSVSGTEQKSQTENLIHRLVPNEKTKFIKQGYQILESILRDFARSKTDAHFGLEAEKQFQSGNFPDLARLLLGLLLHHLKQFSAYFGLTPELIDQSQLQTLILYLPYTIAVDLLLLYSFSEPKDQPAEMKKKIDRNILSGLMAACLDNFYKSVDLYRGTTKSPPS